MEFKPGVDFIKAKSCAQSHFTPNFWEALQGVKVRPERKNLVDSINGFMKSTPGRSSGALNSIPATQLQMLCCSFYFTIY